MSRTNSKMETRVRLLKRFGEEFERFQTAIDSSRDPILMLLRTHLFTEQILEALIRSWLPKPQRLLDRRGLAYAKKLDLVDALDVVEPSVIDSLRELNAVRNNCAHDLDAKVTESEVDRIGRPFGSWYDSTKIEHAGNLDAQLFLTLHRLAGLLAAQIRGPHA